MSANQIALSERSAEQRNQQIRQDLRNLGWHDWWLWVLALIVILAMTATLAAVLASQSDSDDRIFELTMGQSIRGLLGLVLIFSAYTFYQQLQLKKTRGRLAKQMEIATEQYDRAEQALALVTPDELTGLHDERFGQLRLAAEVARARRNGTPLTILMLGLNDLAQISERFGLAAGDSATRTLAERVNRAIRGCDLAVRSGKGEVMVILPECPLDQVQSVVNRLFPMKIQADNKAVPLGFTASFVAYKAEETTEEFLARSHREFEAKKAPWVNQPQPVA